MRRGLAVGWALLAVLVTVDSGVWFCGDGFQAVMPDDDHFIGLYAKGFFEPVGYGFKDFGQLKGLPATGVSVINDSALNSERKAVFLSAGGFYC
jgi:hypothetical protein